MSQSIDINMLHQLKELLGDQFGELIKRFSEDGQRRVNLLIEAIKTMDHDVIFAEAHGLKGSSKNIGANTLGAICGELEEAGRKKLSMDLKPLIASVEQEFAAVCRQLKDINASF